MIEARLWFKGDQVSTGPWSDPKDDVVEMRLEFVPRIGETVNAPSETGRTYSRKVADVEWDIAADGKQSVFLTLVDPYADEED
jgi:hypothetical protein